MNSFLSLRYFLQVVMFDSVSKQFVVHVFLKSNFNFFKSLFSFKNFIWKVVLIL